LYKKKESCVEVLVEAIGKNAKLLQRGEFSWKIKKVVVIHKKL
jgi:hypothetical protein